MDYSMSELLVNAIKGVSDGTSVDFPNGATVGGQPITSGVSANAFKQSIGSRDSVNNNGVRGIAGEQCSWVMIGDSFRDGVGASAFTKSTGWMMGRSIFNANDFGYPNERGYGYHSTVNWSSALQSGLFTTTGNIVDKGVVHSQLRLATNESLSMTGVAVDFADLIIDGTGTAATIAVTLNNVNVRTINIGTATGLASTFTGETVKSNSTLTAETDVIKFTVTSGSVDITTALAWRRAGYSPVGYVASLGGTTYSDYTNSAALDEIAFYLNFARTGFSKYLMLALGTNSIYNPNKYQSPAQMIASIEAIRVGIINRCIGVKFIIHVPAKAGPAWTNIVGGFTWENFRDALVDYCYSKDIALVRHDRSILGTGDAQYYIGDGLHPNDAGHAVDCANWLETLGVPFNPVIKAPSVVFSMPAELRAAIDAAAASGGGGDSETSSGNWVPTAITSNGNATAYGQREGSWVKDAQGWATATFTVVASWGETPPAAGSLIQIDGLGMIPQSNFTGSGGISYVYGVTIPTGVFHIGCAITGTGAINVLLSTLTGAAPGYLDAHDTTPIGVTICGWVRFKPN
jgi:hypothetical protein